MYNVNMILSYFVVETNAAILREKIENEWEEISGRPTPGLFSRALQIMEGMLEE